jgi:hypothetical protein
MSNQQAAAKFNPPDVPTAVDFAFRHPAEPMTLTAIRPDAPKGEQPITTTFKKTRDGRLGALKWAAQQQRRGANLYFQDCSVVTVNKRPKKADVNLIHCAHVDIDVQGQQDTEGFAKAKAAILDRLGKYDPQPSDMNDTGNGVQAFWHFATALVGTPENIAKVEAINARLAADLGGDNCQDVAHLMRLPSTVNFPKQKKRDLGRVKCASRIVSEDRDVCVYALADLPSAPVEVERGTALNSDPLSYAGIGSPDIPDAVVLSRLSPETQELIRKGAPGNADRSQAVYLVACEMRRMKYGDGEILAVLTDPDFGISDHILDQKQREPIEQASRVIGRMNEKGFTIPDFDKDPADLSTIPDMDAATAKRESKVKDRIQRERDRLKAKQAKRRLIAGLVVTQGSDIEIENINFVWEYVLARGVHTALAGEGGVAKSQLTYNVAAACLIGGRLPDGRNAPQGKVVILNAEDNTKTMYGPRLRAALFSYGLTSKQVDKAMEGVFKVDAVGGAESDRKFSLQSDLQALKELCAQIGNVVLVIIDPASSYMGGSLDGRQNSQVRFVLDPISQLAEDCDFAILSVTHFNKGVAPKAIHRVMDSAAFVTAPRAVWGCFPNPDNGVGVDNLFEKRISFVQMKSNIAPTDGSVKGWQYKLEMVRAGTDAKTGKVVTASRIAWCGAAEMSADQIVAAENERASPQSDAARAFLGAAVADGPRPASDIIAEASAAGIMESTLKKAKRALGVKHFKQKGVADGGWYWSKADDGPRDDEAAIKTADDAIKSVSADSGEDA